MAYFHVKNESEKEWTIPASGQVVNWKPGETKIVDDLVVQLCQTYPGHQFRILNPNEGTLEYEASMVKQLEADANRNAEALQKLEDELKRKKKTLDIAQKRLERTRGSDRSVEDGTPNKA